MSVTTMDARDSRARESQAAIARVLLEDWDPIGVSEVPEAQDEYDPYVGGVYRLLAGGASLEEVAAHLLSIETDAMGLGCRGVSDLIAVAVKLRDLNVRISGPSEEETDPRVEKILAFLNREHRRATYGAVGEALGLAPQTIGGMLGRRRAEASWVVNADTLEPTGYAAEDKHPALHERADVISTGLELLQRMTGLLGGDDGR